MTANGREADIYLRQKNNGKPTGPEHPSRRTDTQAQFSCYQFTLSFAAPTSVDKKFGFSRFTDTAFTNVRPIMKTIAHFIWIDIHHDITGRNTMLNNANCCVAGRCRMSKTLYMLFAVAAYFIFFATFLYLIAFVGSLSVPRTIDEGGTQTSVAAALTVNIALIALFGIQHSVMARQGFKAAWMEIVPKPIERAVYVLAASAMLCILYYFWRPIKGDVWRVENAAGAAVLWALFGLGWVIVLASTFLINHFELFGLQQVWRNMRGHNEAPFKFRTPMFYKLVRHPLYSGFLLAFWATPHMTLGHMLFSIGMTIYILIAISYEEKDLVGYFGQDYEQYQRDVGTLVPGIGKRT